jgi:hypothetical protein
MCGYRYNVNIVVAPLYRYFARFLGYDAVSLEDYYPTIRKLYLKVKALLVIAQSVKHTEQKFLEGINPQLNVKSRVV